MEIFLHELDKKNFFYDYITTLAYSQFGTNELFSRGFIMKKIKDFPNHDDRQQDLLRYDFSPEILKKLVNVKTFTPSIFVPGFETKSNDKVYRMDPDYSAAHFVADTKGITDVNLRITRMTIMSSYEKVVDKIDIWTAVMEFFRHIRNAAAHNGKFHFKPQVLNKDTGELKKTAEWNQFEITAKLQGQSLFSDIKDDQSNFWDQGDFIDFLLDFENHHPEIKKP